jgi:primary-amine oxidase
MEVRMRRPSDRRAFVTGLAALLAALGSSAAALAQSHPLDPLTAAELTATVQILRNAGRIDDASRLPIIRLQEPSKGLVRDWQPGQGFPRRSFAVVKKGASTYEAVVDLDLQALLSFQKIQGVQSPILGEEFPLAQGVALADPRFQAALAARGITSFDTLVCIPLSAGFFGVPSEAGHRLLRVTCLQFDGTNNPFGRPIENLTAVVELNEQRVLEVVDSGVVTLPSGQGGSYPPPSPARPVPQPLVVQQPGGHDFVLTGNQVTSDPWEFHFRVEPREGLVISRVLYNQGGERRSVLYRGGVAELFVPYADPSSNWYYRTFMDEGEYGLGKSTQPLDPQDCPSNAVFVPATLADDLGNPNTIPNAVCIFERTPHLLWKHFDIFTGTQETRPGRELVVRYATIVGNYDYLFEWVFSQNGSVRINTGAGGIMEMKAVSSAHLTDPTAGQDTLYGTLVDENLVASFHQHVFSVRLDLDVDGTPNTFLALTPEVRPAPPGSRRKSTWVYDETRFDREREVGQFLDHAGHGHPEWVVANTSQRNRWGYPVAYKVHPSGHSELLMSEDDFPARRAAFARQELWATPFRADELYAAGDYPNQNPGNDGLQVWTQANRQIRNRDLVLWVNVGLSHHTRAEDWPVMPTEWFGSVALEPFNFFDRNPGLDLPREP